MPAYLGEFEQLVLLAILRLGPRATGGAIRAAVEEGGRRTVWIGAVHTTLERLDAKGLVRVRPRCRCPTARTAAGKVYGSTRRARGDCPGPRDLGPDDARPQAEAGVPVTASALTPPRWLRIFAERVLDPHDREFLLADSSTTNSPRADCRDAP